MLIRGSSIRNTLHASRNTLYNCRGISTNRPIFMQNKPNFWEPPMSVSANITKDYEKKWNTTLGENKPNSNPIAQTPKTNVNSIVTKDYQNICPSGALENKAKTNPIQSQFPESPKIHVNSVLTKDCQNQPSGAPPKTNPYKPNLWRAGRIHFKIGKINVRFL